MLKDKETQIEWWEKGIEAIKEELADRYLDFLDQQKGGMRSTGTDFGININPFKNNAREYLLSRTIDKKQDTLSKVREKLKQNFLGNESWSTSWEYDKKKLNKMKSLITQYKDDREKLQIILKNISDDIDPIVTNVEYDDSMNRAKIIAAMDVLIKKDQDLEDSGQKGIPYIRWSDDLERKWWLDCSGLIDYILTQAWSDFRLGLHLLLKNSTREYFKEISPNLVLGKDEASTKEEWLALIKKEGRLKWIQKWDIVIRNSIAEQYRPKRSKIKYHGKQYYLHHIAMIERVDEEEGKIYILESNGKDWVTKSTVDIWDRLHGDMYKNKSSEFYIGKLNYNTYFNWKTTSKF